MQILRMEQGSEEWFAARRAIPTCSEFGKIITPKRGELSAQSVGYIAELIEELLEFDVEERVRSYWMERGHELQPEATDWYAFRYNVEVEQVGIVLNKGAGYSPDGLVSSNGRGAVEFKAPKPSTHIKWLLKGGLPDEHKPQVHGGLWVGELDWIDFVSYCPGLRPLVVRVTPDKYTENVGNAVKAFLGAYERAKEFIIEEAA